MSEPRSSPCVLGLFSFLLFLSLETYGREIVLMLGQLSIVDLVRVEVVLVCLKHGVCEFALLCDNTR